MAASQTSVEQIARVVAAFLAAGQQAVTPWMTLWSTYARGGFPGPAGAASRTETTTMTTVAGRPLLLPVRIRDAAQGFAIYAVPARDVRAVLEARNVPFPVCEIRPGQAALAVWGTHYRVTDLGRWDELGVVVGVVPREEPTALGGYCVELAVSERLPCDVVAGIWGAAVTEAGVEVALEARRAAWTLRRPPDGTRVLTITFPRDGNATTPAIPLRWYAAGGGRASRALIERGGCTARIQLGGDVTLAFGHSPASRQDPLAEVLRGLGLAEARPVLSGWTEHMTADLGPPTPLAEGA